MSRTLALLAAVLFAASAPRVAAGDDPAARVEREVEAIEELLEQWRFVEARTRAEQLLASHPDLPAVQLVAGWVKMHHAEHRGARALVDRAAAAFGGRLEQDPRVGLVRAAARVGAALEREAGPAGRVVVYRAPGVDRILVPYIIETVGRTLEVVGEDLGFRPDHPILVEILPGPEALAALTGLTPEEIATSGTIAVCKYGRLLITSPRVTLQGFGWLDTASHELVHMIISEKTRNRVPIWLHEALARYEDSRWRAGEPLHRQELHPVEQSKLARAMGEGALITFEQMHPSMAKLPSREAAALAFAEVYTVTAFLLERKGYAGIRELLERIRDGAGDMQAVEDVYGLDRDAFVEAWRGWLARQDLRRLRGELDLAQTGKRDDQRESDEERSLTRAERIDLRDHFHLGQLLRARNHTRAAVVEYTRAVRQAGPDHVALWFLSSKLGIALRAVGRKQEARAAFEQSLSINPDDLESHLRLAEILLEDEPYRAWLHLRACLRRNPLDPRVYPLAHKAAGRLEEAGDEREDWARHQRLYAQAVRLLKRAEMRAHAGAGEPEPAPSSAGAGSVAILKIHTNPWARVWLDYRDTGLTTPVYRLEVEPGTHVVGLAADCLDQPEVVRVRIDAGEQKVIDRELCPADPPPAAAE